MNQSARTITTTHVSMSLGFNKPLNQPKSRANKPQNHPSSHKTKTTSQKHTGCLPIEPRYTFRLQWKNGPQAAVVRFFFPARIKRRSQRGGTSASANKRCCRMTQGEDAAQGVPARMRAFTEGQRGRRRRGGGAAAVGVASRSFQAKIFES